MIYDQIKLEKNYNGLSIKCFSCDQKGHLSHNCPLIHYIPDPEKICRVYEFNPGQKNRREIIRNPAKASNALSSKNETISAYQKFQKVLKELYEDLDNNDSFAQNSDKDSNSSRGSDEDLKEVSPIEMKNSTKSNFNISALKTNNSQKFNPRITLKKVGNDNEKDNENLIENVREPENNYQTDNEMKDINEIFFESNGVERLKNNENRKTDESLKTIEIPSIKKFNDLIINTGISKSACIKINQEKKRHELKMKEFPELNSLNSNSLPENQQIKDGNKIIRSISPEKEDKNEFQFMEPNKNNNFSMSFEMQQLELNENFLIDQKFDDEISKTKKQDNFFDIPHQTSDDLIHFNPQIKTQLFSFELLEGFLPKPIKKMPEFERNEEENNNKIIISPNAVKSTRNKSIFRTKNNIQIKKKSTELTPTTTPTPKVLKKKKSFLDFAKSPLLKLPIFNFESPMIQKTKTLDSSKIQVSEKNKNIETETMAQLSHNTMDIQKNDENFLENLEIDKVANFKNYYPENNIKNIINRMVKAKKKLSLENVRRNPKKHHLTRHFKQYFNKIDMENLSKTNFKSNKIIPKTPSSLNVTPLKKLSENSPQKNSLTPSQNKRPSNIFTTNHNKKNFFQHSFNEITFYDVVYEVMTNKELRKDLLIEKMESKKKKSNNRMKKK